jgi:hypothetical protein
MKLTEDPYCSLDSLKQLLLLFREASASECIIGQDQNTFNKKGDANAELRLATQNRGSASVSPTRSSSNNLEKSIQTTDGTSDETCERDALGIPKTPRRK